MRIIISLIVMCLSANDIIAQTNYKEGLTKISSINEFYFYGLDISNAKVTDPKRGNQDLARYMHELVGEVTPQIDERKMRRWFGVDKVVNRINGTYSVNKSSNKKNATPQTQTQ